MQLEIINPSDYLVGLYIRLSKEDENEGPSESVGNQKSLLDEFAQTHRLSVRDTYVDDGWSGTRFDRPAFNRLLADIEGKKINMVITKDLSRLGRDYILVGHYMERYFPEHRVRYISLLDGIDTGVESTANDITPFRAIMNDMYAKDISKKITSVKRDKQRKGLFIGGKPMYGYMPHPTERNRIVVDEAAAPIVRRIFSMALEGISCREIAARLNAGGVPPPAVYAGLKSAAPGPYAGLWSSERISDMLSNETYIGNMVQGRSKKISYKSKKCVRVPPADWVIVENTHEPLVTPEEFQRVRLLVESRTSTRCRTYDFLLKGLIFCRECGCPMAVINRKKPDGGDCLYFVCRTYQRFTKSGVCSCHSIKEATVTTAVLERLDDILERHISPEVLAPLAEPAVRAARDERLSRRESDGLAAKIAGLTAQLDRVYFDKLGGLLSEEDFLRVYQKLKSDRAAAASRLAIITPKSDTPVDSAELAQTLARSFLSDATRSRELLVSLLERVEYGEDRTLTVHFRFPSPDASR